MPANSTERLPVCQSSANVIRRELDSTVLEETVTSAETLFSRVFGVLFPLVLRYMREGDAEEDLNVCGDVRLREIPGTGLREVPAPAAAGAAAGARMRPDALCPAPAPGCRRPPAGPLVCRALVSGRRLRVLRARERVGAHGAGP